MVAVWGGHTHNRLIHKKWFPMLQNPRCIKPGLHSLKRDAAVKGCIKWFQPQLHRISQVEVSVLERKIRSLGGRPGGWLAKGGESRCCFRDCWACFSDMWENSCEIWCHEFMFEFQLNGKLKMVHPIIPTVLSTYSLVCWITTWS